MHKNNFDFLRLLFAIFVVISHSFELLNRFDLDWLTRLTNGQAKLSYLGVRGFFIISGFLIYGSVLRSKTFAEFYWKRILRLFPGLFVVLFITLLLLPFVYQGTVPYLKNKEVWSYLPNNFFLFNVQGGIQGVFNNKGINGSLWTIKYEFLMYVFLSVIFFFKKHARVFVIFSYLYLVLCFVAGKSWLINIDGNYFNLAFYFIGGAICGIYKQELFKYKRVLMLSATFIFIISLYFSFFASIQFFVLPLIVIPFGISSTRYINSIGAAVGDLSYGIYLSGYPIQQSLIHYFKVTPYGLLIAALCLSAVYAYSSWHLIEKKALRLKDWRFAYPWKKRVKAD